MYTLLETCVSNPDISKHTHTHTHTQNLLLSFNPEKKLSRMLDKFAGQEDLIKIFKNKEETLLNLQKATHRLMII